MSSERGGRRETAMQDLTTYMSKFELMQGSSVVELRGDGDSKSGDPASWQRYGTMREAKGKRDDPRLALKVGCRQYPLKIVVIVPWYRPWRRYSLFRERFFLLLFSRPESVVAIVW